VPIIEMNITQRDINELKQSLEKTENNVVDIKRAVDAIRRDLMSYTETVERCNNILRQLSSRSGTCNETFYNYFMRGIAFNRIEPPSAQALNRTKNRYDELKTYFINRWLGHDYIPTNDEYADERKQKMTVVDYHKEMLDDHDKSACAVMVKQFYLDKVEWSTWTYRHIPAGRRLNVAKNHRQLAEVSGIPTYRYKDFLDNDGDEDAGEGPSNMPPANRRRNDVDE
ncbi:hypothetical protein A0J61_11337, partial [Choanephora cucurbitarum]